MAEFVTWSQIEPIIYLMVIIGGGLIFVKWRMEYVTKQQKSAASRIKKENSIENMIDKKLSSLPGSLKKIQEELRHLESTGANKEQMKSLKDKERMLELGIEYGDLAAEIGKPLIKKVITMVKAIGA